MPLNKQKLRKIVGVLEPAFKGELMADQLREEVSENLNKLVQNFNSKIRKIKDDLLSEVETRLKDVPDLSEDLTVLQLELENRLDELEKEEIPNIQTQMQDMASSGIDSKDFTKELEKKFEDKLEEVRDDIHFRISNRGGGNANRQININSSVMSNYYTDINFQQFGNISWSATNDHNLKRVNIRASILTGDTGITQLTGDVTAGPGSGSQTATLASILTAGGPVGSSTVTPTITWDAKGRLTAVSSVATATAPTDATYVLMSASGGLSAERVLTAGSGISVTDSGANGNVTIAQTIAISAYKTADETVTDTTLQNDDHLTASLAASATYWFKFFLFHTNAGALEGVKVALNGTVGVTALKAQIQGWDDTTNSLAALSRVAALNTSVGWGLGSGDNFTEITGTIETSTAGTLLLQFAQNAAGGGAGVTMQRNSSLVILRLA